jgi:hypothetical protein
MPIKNYTTKINQGQTVAEIQALLAAKGAQSIMVDYENGDPTALAFMVKWQGQEVPFRLPCNWEGALAALKRDRRKVDETQARAIAWRIVKDWVAAQMAIIEAGQATLQEVFLPYALVNKQTTLFQRMTIDPGRLLGAGEL